MRIACSVLALVCAAAAPAHADFIISADPTQNVNCSGTTCTASAKNAVLNVQDLEGRLAASDVTLASGSAKDIHFVAPVSWRNASGLSVDAQRSIKVDQSISVAGDGALNLRTNHGASDGDLLIRPLGKIDFLGTGNALMINGKAYVLVNSIATLASTVAANPRSHVALANDYNAAVDGTYSSSPVRVFRGTFEGLGHTISGLTINDPTAQQLVGLFAATGSSTIRDLNLRNAKVTGSAFSEVGALVAIGDGAQIVNVDVSGVASGGQFSFVGLLAGFCIRGQIGNHFVYSSITRSRTSGQVTGEYRSLVGGLAGASTGVILSSSSSATVAGGGRSYVGGLTGFGVNTVENSFATGAASGGHRSNVGGLLGANGAVVTESYALGNVVTKDDGRAGGLVGLELRFSSIFESYSAGHVSGGTPASLGGFIGFDHTTGSIGTSHWDVDTSGLSQAAGNVQNDPGITGLSDAQLRAGLPPDFDPNDWAHDPNVNGGYPYLKKNRPPPVD